MVQVGKGKPEAKRKSRSTPEQVIKVAKAIERSTKRRASEAAVRAKLGGGSPNFVSRVLKEWRASAKPDVTKGSRPRAPVTEAAEPDVRSTPEPAPQVGGAGATEGADGARAAADPARATTEGNIATLTRRLDKLQVLLSRQAVDIRLLQSDVQVLGRRVDSLSGVALTEPRPPAPVQNAPGTTGPAPPAPEEDDTIRQRVTVAIAHCVATLVEVGEPMSIDQLQRSLPEDVRVGTKQKLGEYLRIRARKNELVGYAGDRSGMFVAGPGAAAYLDRHVQKPVVQLTETQVARIDGEARFLAALELLEKAGGGPLAVDDFVRALSDGSRKETAQVKTMLKNCFYHVPPRTDDEGRGIGKLNGGHVLTRGQRDAEGRRDGDAQAPPQGDA